MGGQRALIPSSGPGDAFGPPSVDAPLAARMRPRTLDELAGQKDLVGEGRVLRKAIDADRLPSMVLWGPPGTGKTTLARIIAGITESHFAPVSAVSSGVADLRRIITEAQARTRETGRRTLLFIDEIHRFNKAQQDAILPHVEEGTVTFIGATTENPSFEVISPLLSRARVFPLKALGEDDLRAIVARALNDKEHGLAALGADIEDAALDFLVALGNGDARVTLNALDLAAQATEAGDGGRRVIQLPTLHEVAQRRTLRYDKGGDEHYDTISAFIKSIRGSDPDAAVYWLARMLEAGEDPLFVARRIVILAAEDIGLADPQALSVAVAAQQAVSFIGMPEGFLPLSEAALYLATAPKSNSALTAYTAAKAEVEATANRPVPLHLRNAVTGLGHALGHGKGYRYAHDFAGHQVDQQHLPEELAGRRFYKPGTQGYEAEVAKRLESWGKTPPPPEDTDERLPW